jgi:hypothetical protein
MRGWHFGAPVSAKRARSRSLTRKRSTPLETLISSRSYRGLSVPVRSFNQL